MKCSRAWNVREFRDFRGFANFSCTWIGLKGQSHFRETKMGVTSLKIFRFSIRNHRWKALEVYNPETREIYMHANCLWPKFAKFSCREHFMFYSTWNFLEEDIFELNEKGFKPSQHWSPHVYFHWIMIVSSLPGSGNPTSPVMVYLSKNFTFHLHDTIC